MGVDLEVALALVSLADEVTLRFWSPRGVRSRAKADGTLVTEADGAAEESVLRGLRDACPDDGFLGEETGERGGTTGRRWIVDGIDGTNFFAAGEPTWGTLIALESAGAVVLGVISSPAQSRRWWAVRGEGAFTAPIGSRRDVTRLRVSSERVLRPGRVVTLPRYRLLDASRRSLIEELLSGAPLELPWCHQIRVAEGEIDAAVWFGGDTWDHAAPSILVEEAGGRFSDHGGGQRLDTRTAVYSNGLVHDVVLDAVGRVG